MYNAHLSAFSPPSDARGGFQGEEAQREAPVVPCPSERASDIIAGMSVLWECVDHQAKWWGHHFITPEEVGMTLNPEYEGKIRRVLENISTDIPQRCSNKVLTSEGDGARYNERCREQRGDPL